MDDLTARLTTAGASPLRVLLVGMGVTNRAVAGALIRRGHRVVAADDRVLRHTIVES